MKSPQKFTAAQKAQVALAALKGDKTIAQISSLYGVHKTQIFNWKKQLIDTVQEVFKDNKKKEQQREREHGAKLEQLYQLIGQREIELDWLKKKLSNFNP